jgi:conjugal transfer pilus assembly protein TraU
MRARSLLAVLIALMLSASARAASNPTCIGKFPNPLSDICWSCVLPLSIGTAAVGDFGNQEDVPAFNPANPVCHCGANPIVGLALGFWEPARIVEVVRRPFCLPTLGGVDLSPGIPAPAHGRHTTLYGDKEVFYQAHFYANPVLYWLEVLGDYPCLEQGGLDLAYLTEVDPLWNDDELTLILNPDAVLFANPVAVAACAADCIAASLGFGLEKLFWCAGCQGVLYPMDGWVSGHMGGVRSSLLLAQRLTAKMHRELVSWAYHGEKGLCGPYYQPAMDKRAYKTQMLFPVPNTQKTLGKCCQPFGRQTVLWGAGREIPARGEDFSYLLFRKKNCCAGY